MVEDETRLLREGGHQVEVYRPDRGAGGPSAAREGLSAVWSGHAAAQVRRLVQEQRPDVVHCHNLFPALSPAALRVAGEAGAAVVMTLHNYRLACLPATLLRDGRVCEDCVAKVPWRGVVHRCYRDSAGGSAALATSLALHRAIGSFRRVDRFLAVSEFVRGKHVQAGLPSRRVVVKPNFAWPVGRRAGAGDYFLFAGRLSPEKGVRTLLDAWHGLPGRLVIAGDGPEGKELRRLAPQGVEFLGAVEPHGMPALLAGARALIVPSVWYEGAPRGIVEAYAAGVPVIASSIGALPEVVRDSATGLLFPPHDARALAATVRRLEDDGESIRLGEGAWKEWRGRYSPEVGLQELESAYRQALSEPAARQDPS